MRILLTHRYFWPDTAPYAIMLRRLGTDLAREGHDVQVLSSLPSYRKGERAKRSETLDGIRIKRAWVLPERSLGALSRLLNLVLYCSALFWRVLWNRYDVVTASSFPPVLAGATAALASRLTGASFVYHLQDIHPEVSELSGGFMGRQPFRAVFKAIDNWTLRHAACIVVLSEDMAETIRARGLGAMPIRVITNPCLDSADDSQASLVVAPAGKRRVIFAGNLGRFQNLAVLTEGVMRALDDIDDCELVFMGDGAALAGLKGKWGGHPKVRFLPFLPFAQAKPIIAGSAVGLVSLVAGITRVAYPSKIATYVSLDLPVLALVDPQSGMARQIEDRHWGIVPKDASVDAIATGLREVLGSSFVFRKTEVFEPGQNLVEWTALLRDIGRARSGGAVTSAPENMS